jgi:hypothetical protein
MAPLITKRRQQEIPVIIIMFHTEGDEAIITLPEQPHKACFITDRSSPTQHALLDILSEPIRATISQAYQWNPF